MLLLPNRYGPKIQSGRCSATSPAARSQSADWARSARIRKLPLRVRAGGHVREFLPRPRGRERRDQDRRAAVAADLSVRLQPSPTLCLKAEGGTVAGLEPTTRHSAECRLRVKGCRCGYVGSTSGVPEIGDDLSRRTSPQPWARTGHS
jgi:hypothetical protein